MSDYNFRSYNQPRRRGPFSYFLVALIGAIIGGLLTAYIAPNFLYGKIIPVPDVFVVEETKVDNRPEIEINPSDDISTVSSVAKKNMKSVVGITTVVRQREWIWETLQEGVGSGLIVDEKGYILTNSHVIGDGKAESINVLLENGEAIEGKVLWFDKGLDLAVVKVEHDNLDAVELGDSDKLEVGELAVAIGNPLGLDFQRSVTSGVISGLNRSIRVSKYDVIEDLIQTDASINPGNSGGPLLNSKGQVIGVNTAKIRSGEGLGFSIPINTVKPIISQIIETGTFNKVYIGATFIDLELYERHIGKEIDVENGIVTLEITPNSPAAYAGLKSEDIIIDIDGVKIHSTSGFKKVMYTYKEGDTAKIKVLRNGKVLDLDLKFKYE